MFFSRYWGTVIYVNKFSIIIVIKFLDVCIFIYLVESVNIVFLLIYIRNIYHQMITDIFRLFFSWFLVC